TGLRTAADFIVRVYHLCQPVCLRKFIKTQIEKRACTAIGAKGIFRLGLSGGSMVKYLCDAVTSIKTDLSKWKFFFCDERFVDVTNGESTFGAYKKSLIAKTTLLESQFVCINTDISLEECAKDYEEKILKEFQLEYGSVPEFDVLLLGMGPDGHTCSLFPNQNALVEKERLIAPISNSPKPPPQRITMTLPLINNAKCCIFAMTGAGKADIVKRVFVDNEPLPAGMVNPKHGCLVCIFDKTAGIHLSDSN
ncbi:probable 6-phosphogluconolactonase, partial [Teleopsis dalmanni]|uniref:probable 6-phosphogluconolactonase n=1 Tax=Teleopsis dalmanni TaxID=139649 RepID=UPI0018CE3A3A